MRTPIHFQVVALATLLGAAYVLMLWQHEQRAVLEDRQVLIAAQTAAFTAARARMEALNPELDAAERAGLEAALAGVLARPLTPAEAARVAWGRVWVEALIAYATLLVFAAVVLRTPLLQLAIQSRRLDELNTRAQGLLSIVQNATIGLSLSDMDGKVVWVNQGFTRITGFSEGEARGEALAGLLEAIGENPEVANAWALAHAKGGAFGADMLIRDKGGSRLWLRFEGVPIYNDEGQLTGFIHVCTPAEERRAAIRELRRGQAILAAVAALGEQLLRLEQPNAALQVSLRALLQASEGEQAGLYRLGDGQEAVLEFNSQAAMSASALPSRITWEEPPAIEGKRTQLLSTLRLPDGGSVRGRFAVLSLWVHHRPWGLLVFDAGWGGEAAWGEVERLAFDVTADTLMASLERSIDLETLQRERNFSRQVLDGIVDGVAVVDADDRVLYCNPAVGAMLNRDGEAVIGATLEELGLHSSDSEATHDQHGQSREITLAQQQRTLQIREAPYAGAGGRPQRIVLMSDTTERNRLQRDLRSALVVAESASEAKSRFLARVSHELRTPLNALLGYAQLAVVDATGPDQQSALDEVVRAGRHLNRMIDDLIDFASAESGELKVTFETFGLADVVVNAVRLLQGVAGDAGVSLDVEAGAEVPVVGDTWRLTQVLLNLVGNAIKYTPRGGQVTVTWRAVEAQSVVHLDIRDNGRGISKADMARLFVPFERLSSARGRDGTGIGLPLSRLLIERMGGKMDVQSREGEGSLFRVELPLARQHVSA